MDDALANWQWLVTLPRRDAAVVLGAPGPGAVHWLARGFARVGTSIEAATAPESVDCVVTLDPDVMSGGGAPRIHRLLRPGATLAVFEPIPSGLFARGRLFSTQERALHAAGFRRVRCFYVHRGPDEPRHFVPIELPALLAWDRAIEPPSVRARIRRLLFTLGLHAFFFHHRLVVATR
jgi:hypothetical protein